MRGIPHPIRGAGPFVFASAPRPTFLFSPPKLPLFDSRLFIRDPLFRASPIGGGEWAACAVRHSFAVLTAVRLDGSKAALLIAQFRLI